MLNLNIFPDFLEFHIFLEHVLGLSCSKTLKHKSCNILFDIFLIRFRLFWIIFFFVEYSARKSNSSFSQKKHFFSFLSSFKSEKRKNILFQMIGSRYPRKFQSDFCPSCPVFFSFLTCFWKVQCRGALIVRLLIYRNWVNLKPTCFTSVFLWLVNYFGK